MERTTPKYHSVNSRWPEGTREGRDLKPAPQEAMSAAKRLYRFAMKKPFRGKVKLTSGRRYTWIRNHVLYVNPDLGSGEPRCFIDGVPQPRGGGWHELVHLMSHLCANRLFPKARGHGPQHAFLEREMVEHVVSSGWLDGKLKSKPRAAKPKPTPHDKILVSMKRWEAKRKRAETALRKLRRKAAYHERRIAA